MARTFIDPLWLLLPPNATALEQNVLKVAPYDAILDPAIKLLKRCKGDWIGWHILSDDKGRAILDSNNKIQLVYDGGYYLTDPNGNFLVDPDGNFLVSQDYKKRFTTVNDSFLYWLAIEYGVNELAQLLPDLRDRINGGMELHRIHGTPAAMKLVMSWIGFDVDVVEEQFPTIHFPEYQLVLDRFPSDDEVCTIARAARFAQPVRSRLRRLINGWDIDRFLLDGSDWGDMLSDYSGVRVDDIIDCKGSTQMKASFKRIVSLGFIAVNFVWSYSHSST